MNTTSFSPAAQELVALVFEYDQLQLSYIQTVDSLRKQCTQHMQNVNELTATLAARDEEIAALRAELNFTTGETS